MKSDSFLHCSVPDVASQEPQYCEISNVPLRDGDTEVHVCLFVNSPLLVNIIGVGILKARTTTCDLWNTNLIKRDPARIETKSRPTKPCLIESEERRRCRRCFPRGDSSRWFSIRPNSEHDSSFGRTASGASSRSCGRRSENGSSPIRHTTTSSKRKWCCSLPSPATMARRRNSSVISRASSTVMSMYRRASSGDTSVSVF